MGRRIPSWHVTLWFLALLGCTVTAPTAWAQGLYPLLHHYGVEGTGLDPNKLAALATDENGMVLVGTEDGVQRFDGVRWQTLWQEADYNVTALLLGKHAGTTAVYVGGRGRFGLLAKTEDGQFAYTDLSAKLEARQQSFGEVRRLVLQAGRLFVYTSQKLFVLDADKGVALATHPAGKTGFGGLASSDNTVWVNQPGAGLQQVTASALRSVPGGEALAQASIRFSVKAGTQTVLLGTEARGAYELLLYNSQKKELQRWAMAAKPLLQARGFTDAVWLPGSKIRKPMLALATAEHGCVLLDAETGAVRSVLDGNLGLPSGNIHAITAAPDGSLWLAHDGGLTHVALNLPITDLGRVEALRGSPLCLRQWGTYVYVGTSTGLYAVPISAVDDDAAAGQAILDKLEQKQPARKRGREARQVDRPSAAITEQKAAARLVEGVTGKCYQLLDYNGQLLAATDGGIVAVEALRARTVAYGKYYVPQVVVSQLQPGKVFAIKGTQVAVLESHGDYFKETGLLQGYNGNALSVAEGSSGLYINTSNGLWRWVQGKTARVPLPRSLGATTPALQVMGGRVYVFGKSQVAALDEKGNLKPAIAFRPFANWHFVQPQPDVVWAANNNLLVNIQANAARAVLDTCYRLLALPSQVAVLGMADKNSAWALAQNKLYRVPLKGTEPSNIRVLIGGVFNQNESQELNDNAWSYEDNKPGFSFSVPAHAVPALYQYRLVGANGQWSAPTAEGSASFAGLNPGDYTFQARALTAWGVTPVAQYAFTIQTPWYRAWWTIVLYVVLGAAVVYAFIRYRLWRLERQQKRLTEEVSRKTELLQEAKRDLEQKNFLLSETAEQLQKNLEIIRQREQELADRNKSFEENNKLLTLNNRNLVDLTEMVEEQNRELEAQKRDLETKKTELEAANRQLAESNAAIQAAQEQLVKQERDAAIGRLVAQVAHEINSPIGAIKGTAQGMLTSLPETMRLVPSLLREVPPKLTELFLKLAAEALQNEENYSTREERKLRGDYERELAQLGLADVATDVVGDLADRLVKLGPIPDLHIYLPMLGSKRAGELLDATLSLVKIGRSARKIRDAVEATQRIVVNLKLTAYQDQHDEPQEYDLADTIDRVLVLYNYNVKQGIEIIKDYAVVPICKGHPQELGQVWNNLVNNAIHAMGGKGTLHIVVQSLQEGWVQARFTDNGPGIPAENTSKIFDQFFTTKAKGEGTGLGLFICKKIIDKHGGSIEVASRPGQTTFTVTLPTDLAAPHAGGSVPPQNDNEEPTPTSKQTIRQSTTASVGPSA